LLRDRVGLASPSAAGRVRLGFLGPWLFRFENPRFRGLDFLGFSWILSSESRLINGLCGINRGKIFHAVFGPWAFETRERKAAGEAMRKGRSVHSASLTQVLIFSNKLSPWPLPGRVEATQLVQKLNRLDRFRPEPEGSHRRPKRPTLAVFSLSALSGDRMKTGHPFTDDPNFGDRTFRRKPRRWRAFCSASSSGLLYQGS
jgi:hypothetical protein